MKQLTNSTFWAPKEGDTLIGTFTGERLLREEDQDPKAGDGKKGDLMGYKFDDEDGLEIIVGASASIEQVLDKEENKIVKGSVLSFTFEGKGITKKKRPFNKYRVIQFDDLSEAVKYHGRGE